MKKILYITISIILLLVILFIIFTICYEKVNKNAHVRSSKIITVIENFHVKHGRYSKDVAEELNAHGLSTKVVYGVMRTEITIQVHENHFTVYYYEKPLGPFYGYESQSKTWSYFE